MFTSAGIPSLLEQAVSTVIPTVMVVQRTPWRGIRPNLDEHLRKRGLCVERHVLTHGNMKTQADFLKVRLAPEGPN